jgi:nuclear cap-binding protein subunit 1
MRKMIIRFAEEEVRWLTLLVWSGSDRQDFHPIEDPPRLARALRRQWREGSVGIFDGFRIG